MNAGIFELFKSLQITSRKLLISDGDSWDRVNHYFTPLLLSIMSIIICSQEYIVGSPLQCWVPQEFSSGWEQYAENLCWVENTYFIPNNVTSVFVDKVGQFGGHARPKMSLKSEIKYYQWVPFVLIVQALMFYLPNYFWRSMNWRSGIDIRQLMCSAFEASSSNSKVRNKAIEKLIDQYKECFLVNGAFPKKQMFLSLTYCFTKFLYLFNIILQFIINSSFLQTNFFTFGITILHNFYYYHDWQDTGLFPRVSYCQFHIMGTLNDYDPKPYTLQCVLVVNMLIEKIYIILWFGMIFLLVTNTINLIGWIFWFILRGSTSPDYELMDSMESDKTYSMSLSKFNLDSLLVLRLLRKNCLGLNYVFFLRDFYKNTPVVL